MSNKMAGRDSRELCNICDERFTTNVREPVALGCGHSFCRSCLVSLNQTSSIIHCPNCSRIHDGEQPENLPTNFLLLTLLENVTRQREDRHTYIDINACGKEKKCDVSDYCKKKECDDSDYSDSDDSDEDIKKKGNEDKKKKEEDLPQPDSILEDEKSNLVPDTSVEDIKKDNKTNIKRKWSVRGSILLVAIIGGFLSCYVIAPSILRSWGFTDEGPQKHTYASKLMSETARENEGQHPSDSWVSWYQSAGQKGFDAETTLLLYISGFVTFGTAALMVATLVTVYLHYRQQFKKYQIQFRDLQLQQKTNII